MNYSEALAWLYGTQHHGIKPGLENIRRLQKALDFRVAGQRFIHVAGTNGKGSVCAMLDSVCRENGLRTGLYTSPHLVSFRERIRLDGEMISEEEAADGLSKIAVLVADWTPHPTFFEITTALAFDFFRRHQAEVVVLETGLGGRLDATNTITPAVSVITAIDLDHTAWLGPTLEQIAFEKAGIIKPEVPVVSAPQKEAAARVLIRSAEEKNTSLKFVTTPLEKNRVNLAGSHQQLNAALAVAALRAGGFEVMEPAIEKGLTTVSWPGRFQIIESQMPEAGGRKRAAKDRQLSSADSLDSNDPTIKNAPPASAPTLSSIQKSTATDAKQWPCFPIVLDGAHNEAAAERLALTWREVFGDEKCTVILGILKDKEMAAVCRGLLPVADAFVLTPVHSPRTSEPAELQTILRELDPGIDCAIAANFEHALKIAEMRPKKILITGSLFLVGEALAQLDGTGGKPEMSSQ